MVLRKASESLAYNIKSLDLFSGVSLIRCWPTEDEVTSCNQGAPKLGFKCFLFIVLFVINKKVHLFVNAIFIGGRNKFSVEAAFLTAPLRWELETTPVIILRGLESEYIKTIFILSSILAY